MDLDLKWDLGELQEKEIEGKKEEKLTGQKEEKEEEKDKEKQEKGKQMETGDLKNVKEGEKRKEKEEKNDGKERDGKEKEEKEGEEGKENEKGEREKESKLEKKEDKETKKANEKEKNGEKVEEKNKDRKRIVEEAEEEKEKAETMDADEPAKLRSLKLMELKSFETSLNSKNFQILRRLLAYCIPADFSKDLPESTLRTRILEWKYAEGTPDEVGQMVKSIQEDLARLTWDQFKSLAQLFQLNLEFENAQGKKTVVVSNRTAVENRIVELLIFPKSQSRFAMEVQVGMEEGRAEEEEKAQNLDESTLTLSPTTESRSRKDEESQIPSDQAQLHKLKGLMGHFHMSRFHEGYKKIPKMLLGSKAPPKKRRNAQTEEENSTPPKKSRSANKNQPQSFGSITPIVETSTPKTDETRLAIIAPLKSDPLNDIVQSLIARDPGNSVYFDGVHCICIHPVVHFTQNTPACLL